MFFSPLVSVNYNNFGLQSVHTSHNVTVNTNSSLRLCTCARKSFLLLVAWWNLFTSSAWNCFRVRVKPFTCLEALPALLSDAPWVVSFVCAAPFCPTINTKAHRNALHMKYLHIEMHSLRRSSGIRPEKHLNSSELSGVFYATDN